MPDTYSRAEKRMAENEAYFRRRNEAVNESIDTLNQLANEDNLPEMNDASDMKLAFHCECADEDCNERITLRISTYRKLHANRRKFIVKPHHRVTSIEVTTAKKPLYWVVEKSTDVPKAPSRPKKTPLKFA